MRLNGFATPSDDVMVTCFGLPCLGFPVEQIDLTRTRQAVRVPYIRFRGADYHGAYVALVQLPHGGDDVDLIEYEIRDVGLQPHLLWWGEE
jgi:hypothetical protein